MVCPLACGPGSPESSESNSDMAGTVFTVTITFKCGLAVWLPPSREDVPMASKQTSSCVVEQIYPSWRLMAGNMSVPSVADGTMHAWAELWLRCPLAARHDTVAWVIHLCIYTYVHKSDVHNTTVSKSSIYYTLHYTTVVLPVVHIVVVHTIHYVVQ